MQDLTLREARPADSPFLLSLAREAYQDVLSRQFSGWDESVHGTRFAEKVATLPFLIAELDGTPVGAISSSLHDDHLRVNELIVLPAFQNRGIGAWLLGREIERAHDLGVPVRLHTFRLNRAVRFYERHGCVVTARRDDYIDMERAGSSSLPVGFGCVS